jgi:hypothetical protein
MISALIKESVEPGSKLMADDYAGYQKFGKDHDHPVIKHSNLEYVMGLTHTNSIENFWSLFKRGLVGAAPMALLYLTSGEAYARSLAKLTPPICTMGLLVTWVYAVFRPPQVEGRRNRIPALAGFTLPGGK